MGSKFWPKGGVSGLLHHYTDTLVTFEYTNQAVPKPHSLLFIGGLGDGIATTPYMGDIAHALQPTPWSLFSLNLSSSYNQWGLGHLDRDTNEIAECIRYILDYKRSKFDNSKIILMGHSTGSQMVLHYLHRPNPHTSTPTFDRHMEHITRPALDGAIMQAPVSDREALKWVVKEGFMGKTPSELKAVFSQLETLAKDAASRNEPLDIIAPMALTSQMGYSSSLPLSFRRLTSLFSPESPHAPSEDDLFSSDLADEQLAKTFGMVKEQGLLKGKLMVLISGADQAMPDWIDKEELLRRWRRAADGSGDEKVWDEESGLIPNASHALSNDDQAEPRKFLVDKVLKYIDRLE